MRRFTRPSTPCPGKTSRRSIVRALDRYHGLPLRRRRPRGASLAAAGQGRNRKSPQTLEISRLGAEMALASVVPCAPIPPLDLEGRSVKAYTRHMHGEWVCQHHLQAARVKPSSSATTAVRPSASPAEFELPGDRVLISRDGRPAESSSRRRESRGLIALLDAWEPLDEPFPDVDERLPPLRDVEL